MIDPAVIEDAIHAWVVEGSGLETTAVIWGGQGGPPPLHDTWIVLGLAAMRTHGDDWVVDELNVVEFDPLAASVAGADTLALAHGMDTGFGPVRVTTGLGPLTEDTDLWVIRIDDDTLRFAGSFQNALDGLAIDTTGEAGPIEIVGTTQTVAPGEEIRRVSQGMRTVLLQMQCFSYEPLGALAAVMVLDRVLSQLTVPETHGALVAAGMGIGVASQVTQIGGSVGAAARDLEPRAVCEIWLHLSSEVESLGTIIERTIVTDESVDPPVTFEVPEA